MRRSAAGGYAQVPMLCKRTTPPGPCMRMITGDGREEEGGVPRTSPCRSPSTPAHRPRQRAASLLPFCSPCSSGSSNTPQTSSSCCCPSHLLCLRQGRVLASSAHTSASHTAGGVGCMDRFSGAVLHDADAELLRVAGADGRTRCNLPGYCINSCTCTLPSLWDTVYRMVHRYIPAEQGSWPASLETGTAKVQRTEAGVVHFHGTRRGILASLGSAGAIARAPLVRRQAR